MENIIPKIVFVSFFLSMLCFIATIIFVNREKILRWRYKTFDAERLIRIVIHHDTTRTSSYYRLVPPNKIFEIGECRYHYDKVSTIKPKDIFAQATNKDKEFIYFDIEGKQYKYDITKLEKRAQMFGEDNTLEIHYWFNVPIPINFDVVQENIELSAKQMNDMKVNDLFAKLLRLEDQDALLMIILIVTIITILAVAFNIYFSYKTNKMLSDYIKMVTAPVESSLLLFAVIKQRGKKL